MTARLESVTFTSGDRETSVPSFLATPDGHGPHPVVLILRGVAGPDDGYTEIALRLAEWGYVRPDIHISFRGVIFTFAAPACQSSADKISPLANTANKAMESTQCK